MPVHPAGSCIPRGEVKSNLSGKERIRDVPGSDALVVPGLVQETGRPEIEPREVGRLLPRQAIELPSLGVEPVVHMGKAIIGNHLGIGEVGDINDAPKAGGAPNLVGLDEERRVLARVYDHRRRGVRCTNGASVEGGNVVEAGDDGRIEGVTHVNHDETRVSPGYVRAVTKVRAPRPRIAWDKAQGLHVFRIANISYEDAKEGGRAIVAAQEGNPVVNARCVESSAQPIFLSERGEPRAFEVAMSHHLEVLPA